VEFVVLLRLEEGVAGFLKMPSLEVGWAGWLERCFKGETKGLWTPSLRRLVGGSGIASEGMLGEIVEGDGALARQGVVLECFKAV